MLCFVVVFIYALCIHALFFIYSCMFVCCVWCFGFCSHSNYRRACMHSTVGLGTDDGSCGRSPRKGRYKRMLSFACSNQPLYLLLLWDAFAPANFHQQSMARPVSRCRLNAFNEHAIKIKIWPFRFFCGNVFGSGRQWMASMLWRNVMQFTWSITCNCVVHW